MARCSEPLVFFRGKNPSTPKGSQIYVEGRAQTQEWQDQNGIDHYSMKIIASEVQFIGGRVNSNEQVRVPDSDPLDSPSYYDDSDKEFGF
jgi:single-stranded DNA-binding protein